MDPYIEVTSYAVPLQPGESEAEKKVNEERRHNEFLVGEKRPGRTLTFLPRKKYRMTTEKTYRVVDNALRSSTNLRGEIEFALADIRKRELGWRHMPHRNLVSDMGSEMVALNQALAYNEQTKSNSTFFYCYLHGCNRDFWDSASDTDLKAGVMESLIVLNLNSSPDETDERFWLIKDCVGAHMKVHTYRSSPIFQYLSETMAVERKDELVGCEADNVQQFLWRLCEENNTYKKKSHKYHQARFCDVLRGLDGLIHSWSSVLFDVSIPCIELRMLKGKMAKRIRIVGKSDVASDLKSTAKRRTDFANRALKSCGENAVTMAFQLLSSNRYKRMLNIVATIASDLAHSEGHCAKVCRSVGEVHVWWHEMVSGALYNHISGFVRVLSTPNFLDRCKFTLSTVKAVQLLSEEDRMEDDEWAQVSGDYALNVAKCRMIRTLWMFGYPHIFSFFAYGTEAEQGRGQQLQARLRGVVQAGLFGWT